MATATPAGESAATLELSADEYQDFLDDEVERRMHMSRRDFVAAYQRGELDESDPDFTFLAGLLWIGQNGNQAS